MATEKQRGLSGGGECHSIWHNIIMLGRTVEDQGDLPYPCAPTMILDNFQSLVEVIPISCLHFSGLNLNHHTVLSPII